MVDVLLDAKSADQDTFIGPRVQALISRPVSKCIQREPLKEKENNGKWPRASIQYVVAGSLAGSSYAARDLLNLIAELTIKSLKTV